MSVKRTKNVDPDFDEIEEKIRIDNTNPKPEDAEAIADILKAHDPSRALVEIFRAFQKLPEELPESEQFTDLFIRLANDHVNGTRTVRHADIRECRGLLKLAKARQDKRSDKQQKSDAGATSSRRRQHIYDLIESWIRTDPDIKTAAILDRLKDGHSTGYGDDEVEIFSDGDRVFQQDHNGTKWVGISAVKKYVSEIKRELEKSG